MIFVNIFQDESHVNLSLNPSPQGEGLLTPAYSEQFLLPFLPRRKGLGVRSEDDICKHFSGRVMLILSRIFSPLRHIVVPSGERGWG
jgi:hypothetical protein